MLPPPMCVCVCVYIYIHTYRTNKTNTSKQLLVSCLHIHQAYNMLDVKQIISLNIPLLQVNDFTA